MVNTGWETDTVVAIEEEIALPDDEATSSQSKDAEVLSWVAQGRLKLVKTRTIERAEEKTEKRKRGERQNKW